MSIRLHEVRVAPLPVWLDAARLLGPEPFTLHALPSGDVEARGQLSAHAAAEVAARLRGLGIDGRALDVAVVPPLGRAQVRAARLAEARARREATPGFTQRGVRLDEQGRFSLTPEALALEMGRRAANLSVVDVCCGSGGNSIGFARAGCRVVGIELDPGRAADARHNAALYGQAQRVRVLEGDARELLPTLTADLAFIDPPWGRDYDKRSMGLTDLPLLSELLALCARFSQVWIKLPTSFDTRTLPRARAEAVFGAAVGDSRRIKFLWLVMASDGADLTVQRRPDTT